MPNAPFRISEVSPEIGEFTGMGLDREDFIKYVLALMVDMGFERSRFYEIAWDVVREDRVVVLTHQDPERKRPPEQPRLFEFALSSVARMDSGLYPAVESGAGSGADVARKLPDLKLEGRSWVDIPVTAGQRTIAILACDWEGHPDRLTESDRASLRSIGAQVGSYLGLKPMRAIAGYRQHRAQWNKLSQRDLVVAAAEQIAEAVDAAALAVFAFSWPEQRLTKIHSWVPRGFLRHRRRHMEELKESYRIDEYLTGQAWGPEGYRYIVDFRSLGKKPKPPLQWQNSVKWHERLFGDIRTVMYASVGSSDRRYLIRFMNRHNRPELPFLGEFELMENLMDELRADVDATVANQRSEGLQDIAQLAAETNGPSEVADSVIDALRPESVGHFGVLCHQQDAAQFGFAAFKGPKFFGFVFDLAQEWKRDKLYEAAFKKDGFYRLPDYNEDSPLARKLEEIDFKAIKSFAIRTGQTRGVFFVPIATASPIRMGSSKQIPDAGFGTESLLHAYSRLIGNAVETRIARFRVDGARHALGLIGHELRGPLSTANSEAELAVNAARETIRDLHPNSFTSHPAYVRLMRHRSRMEDRQHQVSATLELAPLVAQESEGEMQLHFQAQDTTSLLEEAVEMTRDELRREPGLLRNSKFIFAPSTAGLKSVVCDPEYIRQVFKNVLRNAVNYSIRNGKQPIDVEIIGEPQSHHVGVKVRNWGHPIEESFRDLIFQPWVRGGVQDDVRAIRGMGLGLYLCRRILTAHRGLILFTSVPHPRASRRPSNRLGNETVFEIRIPRGLPPGTRTYRWKGSESGYTAE
jgi:signal transduction histidine kinase